MKGNIWVKSRQGGGQYLFFTAEFGIPEKIAEIEPDVLAGLEKKILPMPKKEPDPNGNKSGDIFSDLAGKHVLLVEDNLVNMQVAAEILKEAKIRIAFAENGETAVKAVQKYAYDAVLMDIQMPVMDGYEATRLIRKAEAENKTVGKRGRIPVIAMTAHAMSEEKAKCFRMEMDDFVPKPIDAEELFGVLARWICPGKNHGPVRKTEKADKISVPESSAFRPEVSSENVENKQVLNMPAGIRRLRGNSKLYLDLLQSFAQEHVDAGKKVTRAIKEGDEKTALAVCHLVKGMAGNLAAEALYETALALETEIRKSDSIKIAAYLAVFSDNLHKLMETIRVVGTKRPESISTNPKEKGPPDLSDLATIITELDDLLKSNSLKSNAAFSRLQKKLYPKNEECLSKLESRIDGFDFKGARKTLSKLFEQITGEKKEIREE